MPDDYKIDPILIEASKHMNEAVKAIEAFGTWYAERLRRDFEAIGKAVLANLSVPETSDHDSNMVQDLPR